MRTFKRAAVATIAAGSLTFLGAGVAHAHSGDDVSVSQKQVCDNTVKKQKNDAKRNKQSSVGSSFKCSQVVHID